MARLLRVVNNMTFLKSSLFWFLAIVLGTGTWVIISLTTKTYNEFDALGPMLLFPIIIIFSIPLIVFLSARKQQKKWENRKDKIRGSSRMRTLKFLMLALILMIFPVLFKLIQEMK
jgi:cytochrome bd-type quinol oxidase subunit 2